MTYPIEGRVLDLEGQPIPGVRIRVASSQARRFGRLAGNAFWRARVLHLPERISPEFVGGLSRAVTGKDGRFRLTGLGATASWMSSCVGRKSSGATFEVVTRRKLPPGCDRS